MRGIHHILDGPKMCDGGSFQTSHNSPFTGEHLFYDIGILISLAMILVVGLVLFHRTWLTIQG